MAYIKSDTEKDKILRNDKSKLREEISIRQKELGLRGMVPRNNQNEYKQLEDIKSESSHIKETMKQAKEERLKRAEEERKAKRKSADELLKMYLAKCEQKDKSNYEQRKIVFRDGGFGDYEDVIRMPSFRVLLKEIKEESINGIQLPNNHFNKMSKYKVICVGAGCENIEVDKCVLVEPYSGFEIVSKKDTYRIVFFEDILVTMDN